jgi:hypothetical protein
MLNGVIGNPKSLTDLDQRFIKLSLAGVLGRTEAEQ